MSLSKPEKVVILSGPSGVGKDTILDRWLQLDPRVHRVVTCTTRNPRDGEIEGKHYFFLTPDEFVHQAKIGKFLEYKNVHGNWYASPIAEIDRIVELGGIAILKIDVQGAIEVMEAEPNLCTIFLLPPSLEELENRIRARATDSEAIIETRLQGAKEEINKAVFYRHQIINHNVEDTVLTIMNLFRSQQ